MDKDTIWVAHPAAEEAEHDEALSIPAAGEDERRTMLCRSCHLPRVFRRRRLRDPLHFILALGTLGLWLPVWGILILLQRFKPWACTVCRTHQQNG